MAQVTGGMTAGEAADRLGVKTATLYAYVSRGVLRRRRGPTGQSVFDPEEVERLARRGRPRHRPSTGDAEIVIESAVTALGADRPYFRGRDGLALAAATPFESVAEWLWTGDPAVLDEPPGPWTPPAAGVAAARAAQSGLPADLLPLERLQVIVPALGATDPLRANLDPAAVLDVGRALIAGMVASLPPASPTASFPATGAIAAQLWSRLAPARPRARLADALRMALVLLADHELAASTFAVRVAASVRADPYAVVMAGLGTVSGPLHGGASLGAEALLAEAAGPTGVRDAVGLRLRRGDRIPGFGHAVYRPTDGRAGVLLDRVRTLSPNHPVLAVADALLVEVRRRRLPEPNIDFALAVLSRVAGLRAGAGEAIFAVARTAGWLAHAREEYQHRTRLRPRAVYIGPPIGA
jgi:citrate synthase